jgi:hypothetical protein
MRSLSASRGSGKERALINCVPEEKPTDAKPSSPYVRPAKPSAQLPPDEVGDIDVRKLDDLYSRLFPSDGKRNLGEMPIDKDKDEQRSETPRDTIRNKAVAAVKALESKKPVAKKAFAKPRASSPPSFTPGKKVTTSPALIPPSSLELSTPTCQRAISSSSSTSAPSSTSPNSRARSSSLSAPSSRFAAEDDGDVDTTATATKKIPMADATTMTIEDLQMDQCDFDPSRPQLKAKLMEKLGLEKAVIDKLDPDNSGCFNDGIWIVSDAATTGLVLKLVPHQNPGRKADREKYAEIQQRCPKILTEFSMTFPIMIFQLIEPSGAIKKDLIVMRKAMGMQITQHLFCSFHGGRTAELPAIFQDFGKFIKAIHLTYRVNGKSMQHGDCQPSNVFYDEVSRVFTLVDVADFGFGPYLAEGGEDDVQHFIDGLHTLTEWYGKALIEDCAKHFRRGNGVSSHSAQYRSRLS